MGDAHAPAWKNLANLGVELVGIQSAHPANAAALAGKYDLKAYPDYEALLADADQRMYRDKAARRGHGLVNTPAHDFMPTDLYDNTPVKNRRPVPLTQTVA